MNLNQKKIEVESPIRLHVKNSTNRIKGNKNGLVVHRDLKCKPNHIRMDICIEHVDIVRIRNPIKRRERLPTSLMENNRKISISKSI